MIEPRSFDHLLARRPKGTESNLDTTNEPAPVQPLAELRFHFDPDPDHDFPVELKPNRLGFDHLAHIYVASITLHAGGLPLVDLPLAW